MTASAITNTSLVLFERRAFDAAGIKSQKIQKNLEKPGLVHRKEYRTLDNGVNRRKPSKGRKRTKYDLTSN